MKRQLLLSSIAATTLILTAAPAMAEDVEVGIAGAIKGDVRVSTQDKPKEARVARKQRFFWGDVIRTKKKSQLHILLLDRSTFTIGSRTQMVIDRFVYDPNEGRSFFARIFEGAFRFMSGRNDANSGGTIETPTGTIGIRGTALDGIVGEEAMEIAEEEAAIPEDTDHDEDTATLIVLRGPGEATEGDLTVGEIDVTAAGETVELNQPGFAAYIPREGSPPIGPFRLSFAGLGRIQDQLQPSVTRANSGNGLVKALAGIAVIAGAALILSDDDDPVEPNSTADQPSPKDSAGRPPID
ncbi:MAG TPA: hypothetical protein DCS24_08660 [Erythrobacter sp.]|nr:hypothetical protein [Erythrobacter sp.]